MSDVWKESEVEMKDKRTIKRMLVKACCMAGILVSLDMNIDSWRTWVMIFSLAIALDLDILFLNVDKGNYSGKSGFSGKSGYSGQ